MEITMFALYNSRTAKKPLGLFKSEWTAGEAQREFFLTTESWRVEKVKVKIEQLKTTLTQ